MKYPRMLVFKTFVLDKYVGTASVFFRKLRVEDLTNKYIFFCGENINYGRSLVYIVLQMSVNNPWERIARALYMGCDFSQSVSMLDAPRRGGVGGVPAVADSRGCWLTLFLQCACMVFLCYFYFSL